MNTEIKIIPLKGITINNKLNIMFGNTFNEIMSCLKLEHIDVANKSYFFDNNLCLEFDSENKLVFIEFSNSEIITLNMFGQNPFKLTDEELISFLYKHYNIYDNMPTDFSEIADYILKPQNISMYRSITPYSIMLSIEEAKNSGCYHEDMNRDYLKFRFFETIGIAAEGYFG